MDDLVAVGSRINELWAEDLKYLKDRLARKKPIYSDTLESMYAVSEEEGEPLEISTAPTSIDINSTPTSEEAPSLDLDSALSSTGNKVVQRKAEPKPASTGLKLSI